jgi:hypothetical protein
LGHGADQLAVLDNGTAAHVDVKQGTKEICRKIAFLSQKIHKKEVFT